MRPEFVLSDNSLVGELTQIDKDKSVVRFMRQYPDHILLSHILSGLTRSTGFTNVLEHQVGVGMAADAACKLFNFTDEFSALFIGTALKHDNVTFLNKAKPNDLAAHYLKMPWFENHREAVEVITNELSKQGEKHVFRGPNIEMSCDYLLEKIMAYKAKHEPSADMLIRLLNLPIESDLVAATGPSFHIDFAKGKTTMQQQLMYYLDSLMMSIEITSRKDLFDYTRIEDRNIPIKLPTRQNDPDAEFPKFTLFLSKLVDPRIRIDETAIRNPNPRSGHEVVNYYTKELERNNIYSYWDVERENIEKVENNLYQYLNDIGVEINKPSDLPKMIVSKIFNN